MADDAKEAEVKTKKAEIEKKLQEEAVLLEAEKKKMNDEKLDAIKERCGEQKNLDNLSQEDIIEVIKQYHERSYINESQKWDLDFEVRKGDLEIHELNSKVNDLRGKFEKPKLKKVSQYENKLAKLQNKVVNEFNFKGQLKSVGK